MRQRLGAKAFVVATGSRPYRPTDVDFRHPLVEGVDFPRALVRSAWWDADAQALHVTLVPGTNAAEPTRFRVTGLDPAKPWEVLRDGAHLVRVGDWAAGLPGEGVRIAAPGVLEITTPLQAEQRFEVRAPGGPGARQPPRSAQRPAGSAS